MPTPTYTPLANITLTGSQNTVTFSNIPNTYRDLVLVMTYTSSSAGAAVRITVNGDTGTNYSYLRMIGDATSARANSGTPSYIYAGDHNTLIRNNLIQFMDYSATNKHKSVLVRYNGNNESVQAAVSRWANTNAITSITISTGTGTWSPGSTFALYGIVG